MTATTADTAATRDRTDYSLGVDDAERARLLAQCAMHRAEAELLLDRVGLRPGDRALDLGCGPLGVLALLAERSPKVVSRDEILDTVWSSDHLGNQRTVDNSIVRLRGLFPGSSPIRSVRGVGYQWMEGEEE